MPGVNIGGIPPASIVYYEVVMERRWLARLQEYLVKSSTGGAGKAICGGWEG